MSLHARFESLFRQVEPAVCLVPERHLRKFLRAQRDLGRSVPGTANLPVWAAREDVAAAECFFDEVRQHPTPRVLLLTDPNDRQLDRRPEGVALHAYWRSLFQAAILRAIDAEGPSDAECRRRLAALGEPAAREVRYVLEADHLVAPGADDVAAYGTFAAVYLDLHRFAPEAVNDFFPSLPDAATVLGVFTVMPDPEAYRPAGTPDKPVAVVEAALGPQRRPENGGAADPCPPDATAEKAAGRGNLVRAAIRYAKIAGVRGRARDALDALVGRLGDVLGWTASTRNEWAEAVTPLLAAATDGSWPPAARALYELQKIPADLSGGVFAVDAVEWVRSVGRRPVKRPLPKARDTILLRHLRAAGKHLPGAGLSPAAEATLERLLAGEVHHAESRLREEFTPILARAVQDAGLRPTTTAEAVARDKLVAELLDRVCDTGYLRVGDVRDAVARNRLKMPDLAGPLEFVRGDAILRADGRLAHDLDGVYRRGEVYLRAIQRFSSLFFGTPWGRAFTLYVALPFGGAFLALTFAEELRHIGAAVSGLVSKVLAPPAPKPIPTPAAPPAADEAEEWDDETAAVGPLHVNAAEAGDVTRQVVGSTAAVPHPHENHGSFLIEAETIVGVGFFFLLVIHAPPFRRAVYAAFRSVGQFLRLALWDGPVAVWNSHPVLLVRHNAVTRFVVRYLGGPLVLTALFVLFLAALGASPARLLSWGVVFLAVVAVAATTRLGWLAQDRFAEGLSDWWRLVRSNLLPGLIGAIVYAFRRLAGWVERRLYAVDEWLRFRGGDSRASLVLKAALGVVWFPVAYLTRFAFYLLVEPQVNPVKHFPVVTVSHKVIWPMVPQLAALTGLSEWTVALVVNGVPGVFGFMAWELMANWRLYRANRPETLKPVLIGSHGETMRALLRPGFHSGTVPKAHRKLRAAWRAGRRDRLGRWHHDLDHVAEAVRRFAERELVALLQTCPEWADTPLHVRAVGWGCQRLVLVVTVGRPGPEPVLLGFENRDGRIEASVENAGALEKLDDAQRSSFRDAVAGLFDLGAAESFDGVERSVDGKPAGPYARRWKWNEWVKRWERPA